MIDLANDALVSLKISYKDKTSTLVVFCPILHLLEIILPIKRAAGETAIFGLIEGWKFTGYTGFASHGAAIAIILSMYWYSRKHLNKSLLFILDRLSIVCALGAAFVRIGNFFNSEIYGKPTGSNLGIIFKNSDAEMLPRHPTQLYEALCYLFLFFILCALPLLCCVFDLFLHFFPCFGR